MKHSEICIRCKSQSLGQSYIFYYGEKGGSRKSSHFISTSYVEQTITNYRIGGQGSSFVCDNCIKNQRLKQYISLIAGAPIIIYVGLFFHFFPIREPSPIPGAIIVLVTIFYLTFIPWLFSIRTRIRNIGNNLAINFHRNKLKLNGYDKFWNPSQYNNLEQY